MGRNRYLYIAAALLLVGCASTQTASLDTAVPVPSAEGAQWTFRAETTWSHPVHIAITINKTPLSGAMEINPGDIIGAYQGHAIRAQCKTEWHEGAAYGTGSCYVYVDGTQVAILIL